MGLINEEVRKVLVISIVTGISTGLIFELRYLTEPHTSKLRQRELLIKMLQTFFVGFITSFVTRSVFYVYLRLMDGE